MRSIAAGRCRLHVGQERVSCRDVILSDLFSEASAKGKAKNLGGPRSHRAEALAASGGMFTPSEVERPPAPLALLSPAP